MHVTFNYSFIVERRSRNENDTFSLCLEEWKNERKEIRLGILEMKMKFWLFGREKIRKERQSKIHRSHHLLIHPTLRKKIDEKFLTK